MSKKNYKLKQFVLIFATQHRYAWPDIGSQRSLVLVVVQNWHSPFQGQSNNIYD